MQLFPLTVCAAAVVACSPGGGGYSDNAMDAGPTPQCLEANAHSDLDWIQKNVFTPTCSKFSACHRGAALSAGGLNLEPGNAKDNLVGEMSTVFPDQPLVVPGDPANSYLMVMLGSYTGPLDPDVGTMPFNNPLLCRQKRDAIERWIASLVNRAPREKLWVKRQGWSVP